MLIYFVLHIDDPPQANAGQDYFLPSASTGIVLQGNGSTDDVGIVSYQWRQIAGDPTGLTLTGVDRPNLGVDGLVPGGFYRFELTVTDGIGQTSTDTANIIVEEGRYRASDHGKCSSHHFYPSLMSMTVSNKCIAEIQTALRGFEPMSEESRFIED